MKFKEAIEKYVKGLGRDKGAVVLGDLEQYHDYLITINSDEKGKSDFIIVEDICESSLIDFVGDYLLRKVELNEKNYISVLNNFKAFFEYLRQNNDITEQKADKIIKILNYYIEIIPVLKKFERKLKEFINSSLGSYGRMKEIKSSLVTVERIENDNLWLNVMAEDKIIGPFVVTDEIAQSARRGFSFECEYGRIGNEYYFIFVGNVYPEGFEV